MTSSARPAAARRPSAGKHAAAGPVRAGTFQKARAALRTAIARPVTTARAKAKPVRRSYPRARPAPQPDSAKTSSAVTSGSANDSRGRASGAIRMVFSDATPFATAATERSAAACRRACSANGARARRYRVSASAARGATRIPAGLCRAPGIPASRVAAWAPWRASRRPRSASQAPTRPRAVRDDGTPSTRRSRDRS